MTDSGIHQNRSVARLRPQNVRTRLTLWYVAVLAGVLLIYGASTCTLMFFRLQNQLDRLAVEDLETVEGFLTFDDTGKMLLRNDYHDHPYPAKEQERLMEVWSVDGSLLFRNERLGSLSLGAPPTPEEGATSYSQRSIRLSDTTPVRLVSRHHVVEGHPTVIRLGFSEAPLWQSVWEAVLGLIAGLPLALGVAGVAGHFLAKRALSPMERMAQRAHEINAERLDARLDVENPNDELGHLAQAFNETLGRLERSFDQLRQFTADAAHELRTPLTAIRSVGEAGLRSRGASDHYRDVIGSMLEESGRLSHLVESLLTVARADAGQIRLEKKALPIAPIVQEVTSLLEVLADEKGQHISFEGSTTAVVETDRMIFRQVLVNILDNAIKHSLRGGAISVRVRADGDHRVAIEIEDSGPGIPAEHRSKIFDRFYRVDEARSRQDGGAGLGLAIAKWGTEAHGGHLQLECLPTQGCIFRILLPSVNSRGEETPRQTA